MILFWTIAVGLAALVALPIVAAMLRGRGPAKDAVASDVALYRGQLAEVERDVARRLVDPAEAERLRAEIARRLLAADARGAAGTRVAPRRLTWIAAVVAGVAVVVGGIALYVALGAPGYGDLPLSRRLALSETARAERPSQAEAEAALNPAPLAAPDPDAEALMVRLRDALTSRPGDAYGHALLARNEASLGNYAAAAAAQRAVVGIAGAAATASDLADLANYQVLAAGGYVSPEAEAAIDRVLAADPADGRARYIKGLGEAQVGRYDRAFGIWMPLLREGPADAPWIAPILSQMPEIARRAGIRYDPPPAVAPGPDAADVAAAADMTPEARAEMIAGMVGRLSDRLASDGGPPEDWARLIAALGTLGRAPQAMAIWQEGRQVFASDPDALSLLDAAAASSGVTGEGDANPRPDADAPAPG
jgi:cytochrome c-type biogenesis protein CcmH